MFIITKYIDVFGFGRLSSNILHTVSTDAEVQAILAEALASDEQAQQFISDGCVVSMTRVDLSEEILWHQDLTTWGVYDTESGETVYYRVKNAVFSGVVIP